MRRDELVGVFVLDVMADDYEDLARIHSGVARLVKDCNMATQSDDALKAEVDKAITDLLGRGLAKAYRLSADKIDVEGVPFLGEQGLYFFITDEGRKIQSSYADWPFDESGSLLPGWSPPPE